MKVDKRISDENLLKGASLRFSRHFGALSMANRIGGEQTDAWLVARLHVLDILDEIEKRGLDISKQEVALSDCECCPSLIIETLLYKLSQKPEVRIHWQKG